MDVLTLGDALIGIRSKGQVNRVLPKISAPVKVAWRLFVMFLVPVLIAFGGIHPRLYAPQSEASLSEKFDRLNKGRIPLGLKGNVPFGISYDKKKIIIFRLYFRNPRAWNPSEGLGAFRGRGSGSGPAWGVVLADFDPAKLERILIGRGLGAASVELAKENGVWKVQRPLGCPCEFLKSGKTYPATQLGSRGVTRVGKKSFEGF